MAASTKKKISTRTRAARKGWETRRLKAEAEARKKKAQARARAARKREKEALHERRSLAAKKGAAHRKAKARAAAALGTFVEAVDKKVRERELLAVKRSWHRAKRELAAALDGDYDRYLEILDDLATESGTEWDIAYGSTEAA